MKTMRVLFVVILLATCSGIVTHAQPAPTQTHAAKEKIKKEDLPTAAIKLLDGDAFKGWTVVQAYRVKNKDVQGKEIIEYHVDVKKDNLNQTLKFDKEGNSL